VNVQGDLRKVSCSRSRMQPFVSVFVFVHMIIALGMEIRQYIFRKKKSLSVFLIHVVETRYTIGLQRTGRFQAEIEPCSEVLGATTMPDSPSSTWQDRSGISTKRVALARI